MKRVVIVSACRTAIGTFNGSLAPLGPAEFGAQCAKDAIKRAGIKPEDIQEAFIGNVLGAGLGQNVARQVILKAGVPVTVPAMTINIVCGSGLRSVSLAYQSIVSGNSDIVLAGGTESMTNAPYLIPKARWGARMGDAKIVDSMVHDGLWEIYNGYHMGVTAENIVKEYGLTREEQDQFAVRSQNYAEAAQKADKFVEEITPVVIPGRKGDVVFDKDEYIRYGATIEGMRALKPAFIKDGSVTAGNASGINDSSAMLVVMSLDKAKELGLPYLAEIVSFGTGGVDPKVMGLGPIPATKLALERAGMTIDDIDLVEANEAFAAQSLAVARDLKFDMNKVNVNGGAIALGHPIGASGARILVTLLYEMKRRDAKTGLATLCIGGGMGTTLIVKRA